MNLELTRITKKYMILRDKTEKLLADINNDIGSDFAIDEETALNLNTVLNIVFVGQYSAGKSSIIKMLTGSEDIAIGAGITTQDYTPYAWNGIEIVDTPGIQTGLREDHDAITENAIKKADLLVFVITNELFNPTLKAYFKKLAYDMGKAEQMLLVINKMDRGGEKEVLYADIDEVLTEPYGKYKMKSLNSFSPCFINAESYLEAQEETDLEIKQELLNMSGYEDLEKALNLFADQKGLFGKLRTPIQIMEDLLDNVELNICDDKGDNDKIKELKNTLYNINMYRKKCVRELENKFYAQKQEIKFIGEDLARSIDVNMAESEFCSLQEEAKNRLDDIGQKYQGEIQDLLDNITNEIQGYIECDANDINNSTENYDSVNSTQYSSMDNMEIGNSVTDNAISKVREFGQNKQVISTGVNKGLNFIGGQVYKNKWFFKTRAINNFVSTYRMPVMIGFTFIMEGISWYQEQKKEREIKEAKRKIYDNFKKIANDVEQDGKREYIDPLNEFFDDKIEVIKHLMEENDRSEVRKNARKKITILRNQWEKFADSLSTM